MADATCCVNIKESGCTSTWILQRPLLVLYKNPEGPYTLPLHGVRSQKTIRTMDLQDLVAHMDPLGQYRLYKKSYTGPTLDTYNVLYWSYNCIRSL